MAQIFFNLNPKDEATAKDEKLQNRIMDSVILYGLLCFLVEDRILCLFEPQSHKMKLKTYVELSIDSFIFLCTSTDSLLLFLMFYVLICKI